MTFFCVKCRAKKEVDNYEEQTLRNGAKAAVAYCPDCGTKMFKILSRK